MKKYRVTYGNQKKFTLHAKNNAEARSKAICLWHVPTNARHMLSVICID